MSFLVIFWLGLGNPCHIATKSQHLWAVPRKIKFWSILKKSWDWVRPPPPSLGQIPNFYRKFVLKAPLTCYLRRHRSSCLMPRWSPLSGICMTTSSQIWITVKHQPVEETPRLTCKAKTYLKRIRTRPTTLRVWA